MRYELTAYENEDLKELLTIQSYGVNEHAKNPHVDIEAMVYIKEDEVYTQLNDYISLNVEQLSELIEKLQEVITYLEEE